MAANTLPNFIVIQAIARGHHYASYIDETVDRGYVSCQELSVFSPMAKIQVERATNSTRLVHLRFCHTNKYWVRRGPNAGSNYITGDSNQPEEDTSKQSCTLFEPTFNSAGRLILTHAHSGGVVGLRTASGFRNSYLDVNGNLTVGNVNNHESFTFTVVDWGDLVQLPKRVAFKGDNDRYLRSTVLQRLNYLQFSGEDPNERTAAYEVQLNNTGHLRIKSEHFGLFWKNVAWIRAESSDTGGGDQTTLFWPVLISGNTIALRASNNLFCKRHSADRKSDVVRAEVPSMTVEARLQVEELVLDRSIYDVVYQMEHARIFDERPLIVGTGSAANNTDTDSTLTIRIAYDDTTTYSFSNSISVTSGVSTSISAGLPIIGEGSITISHSITASFEWHRTTEETTTAEASYEVTVPPRSRARVNYVATRGTCNLPFTYTQRDRSSTDGQTVIGHFRDGIFNGVNYYNFHFEQLQLEPLVEELQLDEKLQVDEPIQVEQD